MKLQNKDKNKGKLQCFVKLYKENYFSALLSVKSPQNIFLATFIMFKHIKVGKNVEYMRQKLSKNMLIVKFGLHMKCLYIFFFIPEWNFIPAFLTGMSSFRVETSSWPKRVNGKRHFIIDRVDFIQGWNFTCQHPHSS